MFARLLSFVSKNRLVLLLVAVPIAFAIGQRTVQPIRLVTDKLVEVVRHVPYGVPQPFMVTLPGTHTRVEISTVKEKTTEGKDRIVTTTEPVYCKTQAECDRLYDAAVQRILINAAIKQGTPMPVLLNGVEVNLPLARAFPFSLRLVMSEPGVFHGLVDPGSPLTITNVQTGTVVPPPVLQKPASALSRFKPVFAYPTGLGLAYEIGSVSLPIVGRFSADVLGFAWPHQAGGLGVSKGISPSVDLGLGYVVGTYSGPVVYSTIRF